MLGAAANGVAAHPSRANKREGPLLAALLVHS
jgi:hypothetical protein